MCLGGRSFSCQSSTDVFPSSPCHSPVYALQVAVWRRPQQHLNCWRSQPQPRLHRQLQFHLHKQHQNSQERRCLVTRLRLMTTSIHPADLKGPPLLDGDHQSCQAAHLQVSCAPSWPSSSAQAALHACSHLFLALVLGCMPTASPS